MGEVVEWQFPGGGWVQVFASEERADKSSVTLVEDDVQGRLEELNRLKLQILSVV
jgi:hypothetical protein